MQTRHLGLYVEKVADLDLYSYALHCDHLATYRFVVSGDLSARYPNFYANVFVQLLFVYQLHFCPFNISFAKLLTASFFSVILSFSLKYT